MRLPLAAALLAALTVGLDPGGHLQDFERRTIDARFRQYAAPTPFTDRIVILDISEESIERLRPIYGRWPWPRSVHGEVVEYLAQDGAVAVGFDLLFAEPARRHEVDVAEWEALFALAQQADLAEVRGELTRRLAALQPGEGDREFAAAAARAGNVFQAAAFVPAQPGTPAPDLAVHPAVPVAAGASDAMHAQAVLPIPEALRSARGLGHINLLPDADGTYRRFLPLVWAGSRQAAHPALALAIAAHVQGVPLAAIRRNPDGLAVGDRVLPLLADGSAWIHYQGGTAQSQAGEAFRSHYRHFQYETVLASKDLLAAGLTPHLARGTFHGKIVLVSALAAGLSDLRATPFSPVTPGVEIHANILDSLLAGRFLRAPSALPAFLLILVCACAVAVAAYRPRFSRSVPLAVAAAGGFAGGTWTAFAHGWVLPLVQPLAAMALAYGGVLLARAVATERERRRVRGAFGHYLAPAVLEEVLRAPDKLRLGGERRNMTVLFSDLAGFTTLAEQLPPEEIGGLLNGHLDRMAACVAQTGGTLDKFIGDAVMAEWNAPLAQPDHAARACETALAMLEATDRCVQDWRTVCGSELAIRIGINSGDMVVGNMGSRQVFDYTVIGNEVNTASRLEPLNKAFGTRILVSGATRRAAEAARPGRFAFRTLGRAMPKGRAEPLDIHELAGWMEDLDEAGRARLADFGKAVELYLARRFAEALPRFRAVHAAHPADAAAALFAARCEDYLAHAPPAHWDGAHVQEEK